MSSHPIGYDMTLRFCSTRDRILGNLSDRIKAFAAKHKMTFEPDTTFASGGGICRILTRELVDYDATVVGASEIANSILRRVVEEVGENVPMDIDLKIIDEIGSGDITYGSTRPGATVDRGAKKFERELTELHKFYSEKLERRINDDLKGRNRRRGSGRQ